MSFDFDQFKLDIQDITEQQIRDLRQALRDEEARRAAAPFIAEREDEIVREYQEQHPPEIDEETGLPIWSQPMGAHDAWPINAVVFYEGVQWQNVHPAPNAWEPGDPQHQWVQLTFPDTSPEHPVWVQPTGAHDAYAPGAVVEHQGQLWENTHSGPNAWEPGNPQHQWTPLG